MHASLWAWFWSSLIMRQTHRVYDSKTVTEFNDDLPLRQSKGAPLTSRAQGNRLLGRRSIQRGAKMQVIGCVGH
jgi:hypothetical protein